MMNKSDLLDVVGVRGVGGMPGNGMTTWISIPVAAKILGIGEHSVNILIAEGRLTVREIPPSYRRLIREEVERLAEMSTILAGGQS